VLTGASHLQFTVNTTVAMSMLIAGAKGLLDPIRQAEASYERTGTDTAGLN